MVVYLGVRVVVCVRVAFGGPSVLLLFLLCAVICVCIVVVVVVNVVVGVVVVDVVCC